MLACGFVDFRALSGGPIAFGPVVWQRIMVGIMVWI